MKRSKASFERIPGITIFRIDDNRWKNKESTLEAFQQDEGNLGMNAYSYMLFFAHFLLSLSSLGSLLP